jgi:hypothetical protein
MRSAGVGCGYNRPFRIVPQRGKVTEDDIEPSKSEHWAVLNECVAGSYHPNDPGKFGPKSRSFPGNAFAASSRANVLARESA